MIFGKGLTFKINREKQFGLYEIENIYNPNILTIAINPKEYFEKHKDYSINKKHKDVKKKQKKTRYEF